jgi:paired amphipathic helix protein Sin3a
VRWLQKDETTFYMDEMERVQQWQYYISSYMRIEHTEGVVRSRLQKVLMERNLPSDAAASATATTTTAKDKDASDDGYSPKPLVIHEGLVVRICLNSSKMVFEKGTDDYFVYDTAAVAGGGSGQQQRATAKERREAEAKDAFRREIRSEKVKEKMVTNNAWMKGLSHEDVQKVNNEFQMWKETEAAVGEQDADAAAAAADVTMEG